MAEVVYFLCALTSLGCAALLLRQYKKSRTRLLFWSGLCFLALAATNVLLFVDLTLLPEVSLLGWRNAITLGGLLLLLYGLVWENA